MNLVAAQACIKWHPPMELWSPNESYTFKGLPHLHVFVSTENYVRDREMSELIKLERHYLRGFLLLFMHECNHWFKQIVETIFLCFYGIILSCSVNIQELYE